MSPIFKNSFVILVAVLSLLGGGEAAKITVGFDECDYTGVQDAVDSANPGDIIEVHSGTYQENVNVTKPLILRGVNTGGGMPVVNAQGVGSAITLSADEIWLEGFEAKNSGGWPEAGIKATSSNNTLKGNRINHNRMGILIQGGSNNTVIDNEVNYNVEGIYLRSSHYNLLHGNNVSKNHMLGITLLSSNENTISSNRIVGNWNEFYRMTWSSTYGCGVGIQLQNSNKNYIIKNEIDNGEELELINSSYNKIDSNKIKINRVFIKESLNNTVDSNVDLFEDSIVFYGVGILLLSTSNHNILSDNVYLKMPNY